VYVTIALAIVHMHTVDQAALTTSCQSVQDNAFVMARVKMVHAFVIQAMTGQIAVM